MANKKEDNLNYKDNGTGKSIDWNEKLNQILDGKFSLLTGNESDIQIPKEDMKDFLDIINTIDEKDLEIYSGSYFPIFKRIKYYSSELVKKLKDNTKDSEYNQFIGKLKENIKNEKELLSNLLEKNNITAIEHKSKNYILGEVYGAIYIYLNSEAFKNDFKDELKNKTKIDLEKVLEKINQCTYMFNKEGKRTPLFEKKFNDKNEEYFEFNHPAGNKLDVLFAYKINDVYKFQYGMITTSSNTEIEQDTFFKHPIVVIESEREVNKNPNLSQNELETIIYNNVKKLETIKEKDINNYYDNLTNSKENIDKHLENIDGIFIYGSDILLEKNKNPKKENLSINYLTTSLFLSAQLMYKPEVKPENELNLHYFLDKMKSTFFSTKKTVENIGFTSKNISISNDFMRIIKELSKIELNDDFNKNKLEIIKNLLNENQIPNLFEIIRHVKDRHLEEILPGINNLPTKYFTSDERIRILENFIIGDKTSSFQELNNMKNLIMFLKEDYKFSFLFKERFDNKQNQHQAEEKVNQAEEKEKNTFKNIKLKGFKDKEIIDMVDLNQENILKYIQEGIITDKEIINQYSDELNNYNGDLKNISESKKEPKPERRKNSKKRTEMENLIIENYCISRMNINNKNEEMIKKDFFELIGKESLLKDKDFNKQYENIKKEGEFYLKIIHLYELDLKKRKKELKPELVGSQYYDKIKIKVEELEKQSDFLIKHKRIEKEDKDKFITFLLNEFKQIENKHFEESELLLIADKYIKWKINQNQNNENEFENKSKNKSISNNKTINNDFPIFQ